jgi:hypothetical protein
MKRVILIAALSLAAALTASAALAADAPTAVGAAAPAYIEFNVRDEARAKAFYGAIFKWTFIDYGPTYASFTADGVAGGFAKGAPTGGGGPLMVFPVTDLEAALARVKAAGGTITKPIFAYPGGRRFHFRDLDGYEVATWSAN